MLAIGLQKLARQGKNLTKFTLMKVFGQAVFLGVPLILAKFVSPEKFGSYSLSMMIVYLLTTIMLHSVRIPFIKYANEDLKRTGKINKVFSVDLLFWLISIGIFTIVFLVFSSPLETFAAIDGQELVFLFLALIGISVRIFYDGLFLALNRRLANARFWLGMGIGSIIYITLAYFSYGITVNSVFLMFFIMPPIVFFFVFKKSDYAKLGPWEIEHRYIKKMWDFAAWVAVGGAAVYLLNWGDNIVLRATLSLEDVGIYNLAYQLFKGAIVLTGFLDGYFLPFLSQNLNNRQKINEYIYKKRPILIIIGIIGISILALTIPPLINLIYGQAYDLAGTAIYFLFIGLGFSFYKQLYDPLFNALERYKFVQITNIILVIFNLTMDYILVICWHNILAAAVATMFTYILMAVAYEIYYQLRCKKNILSIN